MTAGRDADGWPMTPEEDRVYQDIIAGTREPDPVHSQAGRAAHEAGRQFHECLHLMFSVAGLSWRFGWNERALEVDR